MNHPAHGPPNLKRSNAKLAAVTTDACPKVFAAESASVAVFEKDLLL